LRYEYKFVSSLGQQDSVAHSTPPEFRCPMEQVKRKSQAAGGGRRERWQDQVPNSALRKSGEEGAPGGKMGVR
jgi:hypothetical protein